jgi:hypothetical protein
MHGKANITIITSINKRAHPVGIDIAHAQPTPDLFVNNNSANVNTGSELFKSCGYE